MKTIAVILIAVAAVLSLSACEGFGGSSDHDGHNDVIFIPRAGQPGRDPDLLLSYPVVSSL